MTRRAEETWIKRGQLDPERKREIAATDHNALVGKSRSRAATGKPLTVPAKAKTAIAYMLDVADDFVRAAEHAKMPAFLLRRYLRLNHVRQHLLDEREVRRLGAQAGNVRKLVEIRDDPEGNQMAKVAAIKTIERLGEDDDGPGRALQQPAGVTIMIESNATAKILPPVVNVTPEPPHHWPSTD